VKLLCIGDSNTFGYDPRSYFGSRYPETVRWTGRLDGYEVLNCGMNGLTIPTDSKAWIGLIENRNSDLVMVMLGSNDLLEGRSAEETAGRMEPFLKDILKTGVTVLLIAPPVMEMGAWVQNESLIQESFDLGRLYGDLASRLGIDYADAREWDIELSYDGGHFTEAGHEAFALGLKKHLEETYHGA